MQDHPRLTSPKRFRWTRHRSTSKPRPIRRPSPPWSPRRPATGKRSATPRRTGRSSPPRNFGPDHIAENEARFFASAEVDRRLLVGLLARIGRRPDQFRKLVEFGCGVGRMTAQFAPLFNELVGLDISRPHLRLAEQTMARFGHRNVRFVHVTPTDLHPVSGFDLWFSRIVLQHNPPPVIMHILDLMFRRLDPGGITIFQVPTYQVGYRFNIGAYLRGDLGSRLEMHVVPQRAVLELGYRHRCRLLDLREDTGVVSQTPDWLSNTFVFQKD